ncbi:MAG TPA: DUF928 domain-containing protein [Nitrospirales bacterium]
MKRLKIVASLVAWTALVLPSHIGAADDPAQRPPAAQSLEKADVKSSPAIPLYRPPKGSVPGGRLKGGNRGGKDFPVIQVLAPNHVGLTRLKQPTLYWYLSKLTTYPLEFTFVDSRAIQPIIEVRLPQPSEPGVQRIGLRDYGIVMDSAVPYRWFVTLVVDPSNPSKDITAGAIVERIDYLESLFIADEGDPSRLAGVGLWYDAIRKVSELIEAAPNDPVYRMQRAALLSQVGLPEIAEADLKRNGNR